MKGNPFFASNAISPTNTGDRNQSARGLFLKCPETFRAHFGCHNSLYVFATPRFSAIKLRNPLGFIYIKNMIKDQLFKTRRLQFDKWLFGPEKFSGLSRNRPLSTEFHRDWRNLELCVTFLGVDIKKIFWKWKFRSWLIKYHTLFSTRLSPLRQVKPHEFPFH